MNAIVVGRNNTRPVKGFAKLPNFIFRAKKLVTYTAKFFSFGIEKKKSNTMRVILAIAIPVFLFTCSCGTSNKSSSPGKTAEKGYNCIGTEPFWNVKVEKTGIIFQLLGEEPVTYPYSPAQKKDATSVYETSAGGSRIKVIITEGSCSDGMSDASYPYHAQVERDGESYRGCAFLIGQNPMRER